MLKMHIPSKIIQATSIQLNFYPLLAFKLTSGIGNKLLIQRKFSIQDSYSQEILI